MKDPSEIQKIKIESYNFRESYANNMTSIIDQLETCMKENNQGIFVCL